MSMSAITVWLSYNYNELVFCTFGESTFCLGDFSFQHDRKEFVVRVEKGNHREWFTFEFEGKQFATNNVWDDDVSLQTVKNVKTKPQTDDIISKIKPLSFECDYTTYNSNFF